MPSEARHVLRQGLDDLFEPGLAQEGLAEPRGLVHGQQAAQLGLWGGGSRPMGGGPSLNALGIPYFAHCAAFLLPLPLRVGGELEVGDEGGQGWSAGRQ